MCLECRLKCAVQPAGELPDPPDSEYGKKPESERKHVGNPGADPVLYESKSKGAGSSRNLYNNKHQYPYRIVPSYHLVAIYKRKCDDDIDPCHGKKYGDQKNRKIFELPDHFHRLTQSFESG